MKTISPNHYNPCCTYTQNINSISHNLLKSLIRTLAIGSSDLLAAVSELKHFAALREGAQKSLLIWTHIASTSTMPRIFRGSPAEQVP
jgi:hypothetical protein